jgi:hypothetical protein
MAIFYYKKGVSGMSKAEKLVWAVLSLDLIT